MNLVKPKIGMWGLGIVGWSVLKYLATAKLSPQDNLDNIKLVNLEQETGIDSSIFNLNNIKLSNFALTVFEQRDLSPEELAQLANLGVSQETNLENFLNSMDMIIPSPGVDLRGYQAYKTKFYSELDLFAANFHKPILAITGSLGKTTITTVLAEFLTKLNLRVGVGGNIGVGMCDLIEQQVELDLVVLELSSFQLEQAQNFRANYALWTNFCTNHLDRHDNLVDYFKAKLNLFELQESTGISLLPNELLDNLELLDLAKIKSKLNCFGLTRPEEKLLKLINPGKINNLYYLRDNFMVREQASVVTNLIAISALDPSILLINWVAIVGFLDLVSNRLVDETPSALSTMQDKFGKQAGNLINILCDYKFVGIEHRVELFAEINGIKFYNDSKSTVPEATLAALDRLTSKAEISASVNPNKTSVDAPSVVNVKISNLKTSIFNSPIILILGGLGKGVQRDKFIGELAEFQRKFKNLKQVLIFGGESQDLKKWCDLANLNSLVCADLPAIIAQVWQIAKAGDSVLFSPSGSSYDLFKNYMVRGQEFKKLVLK